MVGDDAPHFATLWRNKQLEYLFRRELGRKYQPFSVCTRQALDHTCLVTGHLLREAELGDLETLLSNAGLVSSNTFDVIGALEVGWKAVWLQRDTEQVFDPWGISPTVTVSALSELGSKMV